MNATHLSPPALGRAQALAAVATSLLVAACSDAEPTPASTTGGARSGAAPAANIAAPIIRAKDLSERLPELVVNRGALVDGIVAEADPADVESLDSYPYLGTVPFACTVELSDAAGPLTYAWDGGLPIPASGWGELLEVPYGELGSGPETVLYAPFNAAAHAEPSKGLAAPVGNADAFDVETVAVASAPGRLREALQLAKPKSYARYEMRDGALFDGAFTLEAWWRPDGGESNRARRMFEAPGLFRMWVSKVSDILVEFPAQELRMKSAAKLRWGEWNHVALIYNPELKSLRLVLNDSIRGKRVDAPELGPSVNELFVGRSSPKAVTLTGRVDELRVQRVAQDTRSMIERYLVHAAPGPHALSLKLASGATHDVTVWAGAHAEPELSGRERWARGSLEHFDPQANGLTWSPAYWTRDDPLDPPTARTTQPVLYVGDHQAFLFSGETKDSYTNGMGNTRDTWIYHIDRAEWELVDTENPPGRCHQSAAYSPDHDVVLMHGGWINADDKDEYIFDDTWLFHVKERRWEQRDLSKTPIGKASDCGVVYNSQERRFYIFQWRRIWAYDPETDTVERVDDFQVAGEAAPAEPDFFIPGSPICEYDPDRNRALIFGGVDYSGDNTYINPTIEYDFETRTFECFAPDAAPTPRARGAMTYDTKRRRFVLFGGVLDQSSNRKRDLWVYDMDAHQWEELADATPPSRRGGFYKMAYDPELDVFSLLCGRSSRKRFTNEAWRLRIDADARAQATYVFDRSRFMDRERLIVEGAGFELELASSPDCVAWSGPDAVDASARYLRVTLGASAGAPTPNVEAVHFTTAADAPQASDGVTVVEL